MKKLLLNIATVACLFTLTYCGGKEGNTDNNTDTTTAKDSVPKTLDDPVTVSAKRYKLVPVSSPAFADASLTLKDVADDAKLKEGENVFNFEVQNYKLGEQTPDAEGKSLANSGKGQHIHWILNNDPYSAHYEPTVKKDLEKGGYVALAFLSRSYHESVKNKKSYVVKKFTVGDAEPHSIDLTKPQLFYSRPKGTYKWAKGDKLLLDFFLLNTELSPDGNKVRATINGGEYLIDKWQPYAIEGLEIGTVTIKLELIDKAGNVIEGPFNTVERVVTLETPKPTL
ncbi:hypothetical protein [Microscilla marina]|uniref:FHA domain containing protein n=1 Tax=Microscilla marina ATCC 23134 TaxID=313606 RepID=A1ZS26_MICM2|nr:hypothetical protein [Microscilla marina]EAY26749.1 FHA domain containing protein [Microscilla marina ATCC 23134]